MADMDEVASLLHVFEKTNAHGEGLKNIRDAAWAKLKQIDAEHAVASATPAAEPEAEEEPAEEEEENA